MQFKMAITPLLDHWLGIFVNISCSHLQNFQYHFNDNWSGHQKFTLDVFFMLETMSSCDVS